MALTSTEEALVRQLLDQQAAILSLAGNEATITSKLGATKVTLSDLVSASAVADADLLLMRQGTNDKSVTPLLLRSYTQDGMATQKGVQAGDYNTSVAAGTADALTGDYTPNVAALEDGLTLFVRATAANATTTPTFSPDGLPSKTIVKGNNLPLVPADIAGAGHWLEMTFDITLDKWVLQNPATGVSIVLKESDNRQTVLSCPFDNGGLPSYLPATSASLSLTSQNLGAGAARLIVSAANGFDSNGAVERIGAASANLTWAGLTANSTNYLFVDVAADGTLTTGKALVKPVYQVTTTNPAIGSDYFSINQMVMKDSGGTQRYRVYIGEAVTNATTVTSTVTYAALGRYQSTLQAIGPTVVNFNHNLGVMPRVSRMVLVCVTAESNYAVGDELPIQSVKVSGPALTNPYGMVSDHKTAVFMRNTAPALLNKTTATANNVNEANWNVKLYTERGW